MDLVIKVVDSIGVSRPSSISVTKEDVNTVLKAENSFEAFAKLIVLPAFDSDKNAITSSAASVLNEEELKRSYHAMQILASGEDLSSVVGFACSNSALINPTKAGLLAKTLFHAYESSSRAHLPHVNHLLKSLLTKFPNAVISAACAGGKTGIEMNMGPMLLLRDDHVSSSFSLSVFVDMVVKGCCDNALPGTAAQQRPSDPLSKGHRRKFTRSLGEWGLVMKLISQIESPTLDSSASAAEANLAKNLHADASCDAFLSIVDAIAFPPLPNSDGRICNTESFGEETLLKPLGEKEFVDVLVSVATSKEKGMDASVQRTTAAAKALVNAFKLSHERRKQEPASPGLNSVEAGNEVKAEVESTLVGMGVTQKMYKNFLPALHQIVDGMELAGGDNEVSLTHSDTVVLHPGGCSVERPFTTRRLLLVTLVADILCYECDQHDGSPALDALLTIAPKEVEVPSVWTGFCDLFFSYPENNLYQFQFYRLLRCALKMNHEPSLKVVIQKCKLVSRLIKVCTGKHVNTSSSHRGFSLQCLNAIRLQSQALPPKSFLRHYLDSHDGWKEFQQTMKRMTIERCLPGGGIAVPDPNSNAAQLRSSGIPTIDVEELETSSRAMPSLTNDVAKVSTDADHIDIGLGSTFASDLGFDGLTEYIVENQPGGATRSVSASTTEGSSKKKKGKKKKKKKKKNGNAAEGNTATHDTSDDDD